MKTEDIEVGKIYRFDENHDKCTDFELWSGFCQILGPSINWDFTVNAFFIDGMWDDGRQMVSKEIVRLATDAEAKDFLLRTIR